MDRDRINFFFLNMGHFLDHLCMLVFATVAALRLTTEWNMSYAEVIPYATPGYIAFGIFAIPAGWLADKWSKEGMMTIFFIGMGLSTFFTAMASTPLQIGIGLFMIGVFAAIYHPVGIAMVVHGREKTGVPLAINGIFGTKLTAADVGVVLLLAKMVGAFTLLAGVLRLVGGAFGALRLAFVGLTAAGGVLVVALDALGAVFGVIGVAVASLVTTFGAVPIAIAAVGAAIGFLADGVTRFAFDTGTPARDLKVRPGPEEHAEPRCQGAASQARRADQAHWPEEGEGRDRQKDGDHPSLHLERRNRVRLGGTEDGLSAPSLPVRARDTGSVPAGTVAQGEVVYGVASGSVLPATASLTLIHPRLPNAMM